MMMLNMTVTGDSDGDHGDDYADVYDDGDDADADASPVLLTCNDIPPLSGDASQAVRKLTPDLVTIWAAPPYLN